jgi:HSP20 family protein
LRQFIANAGKAGFAGLISIKAPAAGFPSTFSYSICFARGDEAMAESATKLPVKNAEKTPPAAAGAWEPFENLRREIDHAFENFHPGSWRWPFGRRELAWGMAPAVDIVEKEKAYEITAELPGMDEKNVDVKLSNGMLTIKGEKSEEKEEKKKDYYLSERRYGSFQRSFPVPEGVDPDKVEANFKKGVLTVTLPKTADAQKQEKKIAIKAN